MDPEEAVVEFNIAISNRTIPKMDVLITIGNFKAKTEEEPTLKTVWKFGYSATGQWQTCFCVEMEYVTHHFDKIKNSSPPTHLQMDNTTIKYIAFN